MKNEKGKPAKTHSSDVLNKFFLESDEDEYQKTIKSMLLAARIDDAMKQHGLTKGQFATAMKVQPSVISKWLSGTHNFTVETLFDIERVLNVTFIRTKDERPVQTIMTLHVTISVSNMPWHGLSFCSPGSNNDQLISNKLHASVMSPQTVALQN